MPGAGGGDAAATLPGPPGPFAWWVQVETLRALLPLTGVQPGYRPCGRRLWRVFVDWYADARHGGVCEHPRPRGLDRLRPGPPVRFGHMWKDASHETRFLLEALDLAEGRARKHPAGT